MTREEAIRDIEECVLPHVGGISLRMAIDDMKEMDRLSKAVPVTNEQISDAFQVAIANYWESKSKYLTPPPSPCCDTQNIGGKKIEHGEWILCSDKLPDKDGDYIVSHLFCGEPEVGKSWFNTKTGFTFGMVYAWMPLPEVCKYKKKR